MSFKNIDHKIRAYVRLVQSIFKNFKKWDILLYNNFIFVKFKYAVVALVPKLLFTNIVLLKLQLELNQLSYNFLDELQVPDSLSQLYLRLKMYKQP